MSTRSASSRARTRSTKRARCSRRAAHRLRREVAGAVERADAALGQAAAEPDPVGAVHGEAVQEDDRAAAGRAAAPSPSTGGFVAGADEHPQRPERQQQQAGAELDEGGAHQVADGRGQAAMPERERVARHDVEDAGRERGVRQPRQRCAIPPTERNDRVAWCQRARNQKRNPSSRRGEKRPGSKACTGGAPTRQRREGEVEVAGERRCRRCGRPRRRGRARAATSGTTVLIVGRMGIDGDGAGLRSTSRR